MGFETTFVFQVGFAEWLHAAAPTSPLMGFETIMALRLRLMIE